MPARYDGPLQVGVQVDPATPSELVAGCLELAVDVRELDMRASPYDLTARARWATNRCGSRPRPGEPSTSPHRLVSPREPSRYGSD